MRHCHFFFTPAHAGALHNQIQSLLIFQCHVIKGPAYTIQFISSQAFPCTTWSIAEIVKCMASLTDYKPHACSPSSGTRTAAPEPAMAAPVFPTRRAHFKRVRVPLTHAFRSADTSLHQTTTQTKMPSKYRAALCNSTRVQIHTMLGNKGRRHNNPLPV